MSKSLQILIAEDNPGDVTLVREALTEHHIDHELIVVSDGEEAKEYIEHMGKSTNAPCPDLLLLDLNLPNGDGYEVFSWFREHPACANTPAIVVTSSNAPRDRERAAALGAARYFRKPTDLEEFMELGSLIRDLAAERSLL